MATKARDIINKKYNRPESLYGSARSTLFGKFYERILGEWLQKKKCCNLQRWKNPNAVHKPRIYWQNVSVEGFNFGEQQDMKRQMIRALEQKTSHCTPDGVFNKEGKFYVWEAKNWPLYPEKGPKSQILAYFASNPWVLARTLDLSGDQHDISGFWFSYWCNKERDEIEVQEVEQVINSIIGSARFEIIRTDAVLDDCITNQYPWYLKIIEEERDNIESFFDQLLGQNEA
ncbi:MAG: hypothetical protein ACOC7P_00680 [Chloroflexota bacterium]